MPRLPHRSVILLTTWLLVLLCLATWLANPLFHAARALADVAASKQINAPVNWFATHGASADFLTFHRSAILLCLAIGTAPILRRIATESNPFHIETVHTLGTHRRFHAAILTFTVTLLITIGIAIPIQTTSAIQIPPIPWQSLIGALGFTCMLELQLRSLAWCDPPDLTLTHYVLPIALYLVFMTLWSPPGMHAWEPILTSDRFPILPSMWSVLYGSHFIHHGLPLLIMGAGLCLLRKRYPSLWIPISAQAGFLFSIALGALPLGSVISVAAGVILVNRPLFRKAPSAP